MPGRANIDAYLPLTIKPIPGVDTPSARDLRPPVHGPRPATGRELQELAKGLTPTHYVMHYGRQIEGVIVGHRFVGGYDSYETTGYGRRVSVICEAHRAISLAAVIGAAHV